MGSRARVKRARAGKNVSCSNACAYALSAGARRTPVPSRGPCPVCRQVFESRREKLYCSMDCYMRSPQYGAQLRVSNAARVQRAGGDPVRGHTCACLYCGETWHVSRLLKVRRFCSTEHRRLYFAERFDRWIASPGRIALPQAYDEFLTQDELPCLVDGCGWSGHGLCYHMNVAHGFPARDFKRAAGFNLTTGVVSLPMHRTLVGWKRHLERCRVAQPTAQPRADELRYHSLERREHAQKQRALADALTPVVDVACERCGELFSRRVDRRTRFCSGSCRHQAYMTAKQGTHGVGTCCMCSREFLVSWWQRKRVGAGLPVTCSPHCRQRLNSRAPRMKQRARSVGEQQTEVVT